MAKIIDGKLINTEEDNKFIEDWLRQQQTIKVRNKDKGECFFCPCITVNER